MAITEGTVLSILTSINATKAIIKTEPSGQQEELFLWADSSSVVSSTEMVIRTVWLSQLTKAREENLRVRVLHGDDSALIDVLIVPFPASP